jgi:hypothetical protein
MTAVVDVVVTGATNLQLLFMVAEETASTTDAPVPKAWETVPATEIASTSNFFMENLLCFGWKKRLK